MNDCKRYQEMICCLIDGELSQKDAEALMAHIALCPECKATYEAFSAVSAAVADDLEEVPDALHERIMAGVRRSATYEKNKRSRDRRFKSIIAAAACFAVVIVSAVGFSKTLLQRASDVAADEASIATVQAPVDENGLAALPPDSSDSGASAQASVSPAESAAPEASAAPSSTVQPTQDAYLTGGTDNAKSTPAPTASPTPTPEAEEEIGYSSGTTALQPLQTAAPAPTSTTAPVSTTAPAASNATPEASASPTDSGENTDSPATASESGGEAVDSGEEAAAATATPALAKAKRKFSLFALNPFSSAQEEESAAAETEEPTDGILVGSGSATENDAEETEDEKLLREFKELFGMETAPEAEATATPEPEGEPEDEAESADDNSSDAPEKPLPKPDAVYDLTELDDYADFAKLLTGEAKPSETEAPESPAPTMAEPPEGEKPDRYFVFLMKYETLELRLTACAYGDDVYYSLYDESGEQTDADKPVYYLAGCTLDELVDFLSAYEPEVPSPAPSDCAESPVCTPNDSLATQGAK